MEVGIQVSSLKPLLLTQEQVSEAFAQMKVLHCEKVQLQWIDPSVSIEEIAAALKENQLQSVSVQDFYTIIRKNLHYYTRLNAATGAKWLCISRIPEDYKTPVRIDGFIWELRSLQQYLDTLGQKICFHPVSADFDAIAGMDTVGYLLEKMPELNLCLDLYHLNRNCSDMPGFIRRYAGRICMVHFKDSRNGELVPAGQGSTNWDGVVQACLDAGVPYAFVEQEQWKRDPFDCLAEAMDWVTQEIHSCSNS